MRGEDIQQYDLFSYGSLEERVLANHPLRPIRTMVDEVLKALDGRFEEIYDADGRKSIPPQRLLRALLLQILYSVRSERMLMEQLEYNLLFRWFVGLSANEPVWHPTVFTKNRDRLLEGAVAEEFFTLLVNQARRKRLLSDEHFTVDGTLVEAWAGQKSFQRKGVGSQHFHLKIRYAPITVHHERHGCSSLRDGEQVVPGLSDVLHALIAESFSALLSWTGNQQQRALGRTRGLPSELKQH